MNGEPSASSPAILVEDVTKKFRLYHELNRSVKIALMRGGRAKYEEFQALKCVSIEVPEGATYGLIGGNGSGKSTLLKCMAKIYRPDSGTITIRGRVAALLELGSGFHPELSGRDNIYLNGSILGLTRKELDRRFDEIVDFSGIEPFIDTPVKNYSSGMYVRLGFAVAINIDPEVMLVDEVLAVGDEAFQRKTGAKFRDLRNSGKTIVIVSHSMGAVRDLCDYAAWLDHGVLRVAGPTDGVVDEYLRSQDPQRDVTVNPVNVTDLAVLDQAGRDVASVVSGQGLTVAVNVSAVETIGEADLVVDVATIDGVVVSSVKRAVQVGPEARRVSVHIASLPLAPREYQVTVVARTRHEGHGMESRPVGKALIVESGPGIEASTRGFIPVRAEWDIDQPGG